MIAAVASGFTRCLCKPNRGATTADDQLQELRKMKKILDAQIVRAKSTMDTNEAEERESQGNTKKWLDDVKNILYKKEAIDKEIRKAEKGPRRLLPDCCPHSNLGRRISKLMEEMITLSETGRQLSGESLSLPVSKIGMELLEKKIVGETTAMKTLEIVWGLVMDDKTWGIGLYGMGGVGKTAIMKVINNRLLNEQDRFSKVIWVTVSRNMDIARLQDVIAKEVGIGLNEVGRSSDLCEKLSTVGRIVLILDDMWEVFPLHQIGIPDFSGDSGSKIVLTSRSLEVCQMMGCVENIPVQRLSEEEAWELFSGTLGSNQIKEKVESIARNVAKECSGLPLAILTIASAMRAHKTDGEWRVALRDLRESTKWIVNMEDKVIARLEFSYNNLRSDEAKNCFLYFSMYPEDYVVNSDELIDNWVMDGLLSGVRIEEKLNQGRNVLNDLKKCCLIEDNSTDYFEGFLLGNVQMHDLIRDMALHITKKNPRFMVKAGTRVGKLGDEILWEDDCEKVSFIQCYLTEILVSPSCPRVRTLLLHENTLLHQIPDVFFLKMRSLTILNLSGIGIELLPESISDLVNLHVLDLSGCRKLKKLQSVKKLQSLKALRLSSCPIEELPDGMEKLVNLERLNLSDTKLKAFPGHLISKFSSLQELLLRVLQISDFSAYDLLGLNHLERLTVRFASLSDYICYASSEKLQHLNYFSLSVGDPFQIDIPTYHLNIGRGVFLTNDSSQISSNVPFLEKSEYLCLNGFNDFSRLSELAGSKNMRELRSCKISFCEGMEYVLVSEEECYLLYVESLEISNCVKLVTLFNGVPSRCSLSCLKRLDIGFCVNLIYLFSSKLFKELRNLMEIVVYFCENMKQLLASGEENSANEGEGTSDPTVASAAITGSSLKRLSLTGLDKLQTLFSECMLRYFQNLEEIDVRYCEAMKELMINERNRGSDKKSTIILPKLRKMHLEDLPRLRSIWKGYLPLLEILFISDCPELITLFEGSPSSGSLPSLKELIIQRCGEMKYLFSSKFFEQLQNLVKVNVNNCEQMEQLINVEEEKEEKGKFAASDNTWSLRELDLSSLKMLKTVFSQCTLLFFRNLEELTLHYCSGLQKLLLVEENMSGRSSSSSVKNTAVIFPFLKKLHLSCLDELESISIGCLPQMQNMTIQSCPKLITLVNEFSCGHLTQLVIRDCHNLKRVFSLEQFQHLLELQISNCDKLEELIKPSDVKEEEKGTTAEGKLTCAASTSSTLKSINMYFLPKLKRVFSESTLHYFQNLEELILQDCESLEELITEEEKVMSEGNSSVGDNTTITLRGLKVLRLRDLVQLKSIWKGVMICDSLKSVEIYSSPELKRLPEFKTRVQTVLTLE